MLYRENYQLFRGLFNLIHSYPNVFSETENQTVKLNEVIAVRLESGRVLNNEGKFQQLEMVPMPSSSFSIHVVRRVGKHRWRDRKVTFSSSDSSIAQQWVEKIQEIISKPGKEG